MLSEYDAQAKKLSLLELRACQVSLQQHPQALLLKQGDLA
jgi:hypothetical protein